MNRKRINSLLLLALAGMCALGQQEPTHVGNSSAKKPVQLEDLTIKQRLNAQVPLDLSFRDQHGKTVKLGDYFGQRPVILDLAYFRCPMLCDMTLNGLTKALKTLPYDAGKDFDVVVVSINPQERPDEAEAKRQMYLAQYGRSGADRGMHFLVGGEKEIVRLANAVGWGFRWDQRSQQYAHAAAVILLTPQGKVSKYFYGIEPSGRDLRWALVDAGDGKIGTPVDALLLYCFHYDPQTGQYSVNILRVIRLMGLLTVAAVIGLLLFLRRRELRRASSTPGVAYPEPRYTS